MSTPPLPGWTSATSNARFSDPSECAKRASRFERQVFWRNAVEYAAGALVIVLFTGMAVLGFSNGETLIGVAGIMIALGTMVVLWGLAKRASNLEQRPEDPCLLHLRRQYEHQYNALRSVPVWYLGPLVPGLLMFFAAITIGAAETLGWLRALEGTAGYFATMVGLFAAIAFLNAFAARSLRRRIEALDALA